MAIYLFLEIENVAYPSFLLDCPAENLHVNGKQPNDPKKPRCYVSTEENWEEHKTWNMSNLKTCFALLLTASYLLQVIFTFFQKLRTCTEETSSNDNNSSGAVSSLNILGFRKLYKLKTQQHKVEI